MKLLFSLLLLGICAISALAQMPKIETGVSHDLAVWRAAHYSDVRYKLNLTLEKMSPVLKGTIEIRVEVSPKKVDPSDADFTYPIVLDWRKIAGHEKDSIISNVTVNGITVTDLSDSGYVWRAALPYYFALNEHLIFCDGVVPGENVIKLDFISPILTSGSAITRYIDKEDGSEYIYSLLSPSHASTAFPVFDQPDLTAKFNLNMKVPQKWKIVANDDYFEVNQQRVHGSEPAYGFAATRPLNPYLFAFAAGDFQSFGYLRELDEFEVRGTNQDVTRIFHRRNQELEGPSIFMRKSQVSTFRPLALDLWKTARESNKYLDYKSGWPKYDLVLIPDLPSEMIQAAGITFVRESSIIREK